jgi:Zn-dependent M28 family amino/carboxypeptidase
MMRDVGCDVVRVESVRVPYWERGPIEEAEILLPTGAEPLTVCALGGSIATPDEGISAGVMEVRSFDELRGRANEARGKIVFFNRPMDPTIVNTFEAYGKAVDQRSSGAVHAARAGGVAALVRSVTTARDDVPHTGSLNYAAGETRIPAAAVSTLGADRLSSLLRTRPGLTVRLRLSCTSHPEALSGNVIGQITGSTKPDEVILVGGHLDAWDKGHGAHDDGAGCVQAIEVLRLFREIGFAPARTIRAVMFMNEENGNRGGKAYPVSPWRAGERHVAVIESDRGGFSPRGFTVEGDSALLDRVRRWEPLFQEMGGCSFTRGQSGTDVHPTAKLGVPGFGLIVDAHRYFDYHHSDNDIVDAVHPRELEVGAILEAFLCYLISEEGL